MITIQGLIKNLQEINESLRFISENGIPIIDTFAPISTIVNIITTIVATVFGGVITIFLFKRQEKIRIREEIRLDFYKKYEKLYKLLLDKFIDYKEEVNKISNLLSQNNKGEIKGFVDLILKQEDVEHNYECTMKNSINLIIDIKKSLEDLEDFMGAKKTITGYDEYKYNCIKKQIEEYEKDFGELKLRYRILCPDEELIRVLKPFGMEDEYKIDKSQIDEEIKKYKKVLNEIKLKNSRLELLINDMQNINESIEKEFIGKYFENKKVNFR